MQKLPDSCVVRNYSCVVRNYPSSYFSPHAPVFCGFLKKPSAGIPILKEY